MVKTLAQRGCQAEWDAGPLDLTLGESGSRYMVSVTPDVESQVAPLDSRNGGSPFDTADRLGGIDDADAPVAAHRQQMPISRDDDL